MNQMTEILPLQTRVRRRPRIALVSANWHRDIVAQAVQALSRKLVESGVEPEDLELFEVPGAFEIPLHLQQLARSKRFDALIGCALVVNGGIYRHEFVASAVIDGLMRVQLDESLPVFSVVLTPRDFHEHATHREFFRQHFVQKGEEAAVACMSTLRSLEKLAA